MRLSKWKHKPNDELRENTNFQRMDYYYDLLPETFEECRKRIMEELKDDKNTHDVEQRNLSM